VQRGDTALHIAVVEERNEVLQVLLSEGNIDFNLKNKVLLSTCTALVQCCAGARLKIVFMAYAHAEKQ
jgi:ankyrin repeat protein